MDAAGLQLDVFAPGLPTVLPFSNLGGPPTIARKNGSVDGIGMPRTTVVFSSAMPGLECALASCQIMVHGTTAPIDNHMPKVWLSGDRNHADGRLRDLLRL